MLLSLSGRPLTLTGKALRYSPACVTTAAFGHRRMMCNTLLSLVSHFTLLDTLRLPAFARCVECEGEPHPHWACCHGSPCRTSMSYCIVWSLLVSNGWTPQGIEAQPSLWWWVGILTSTTGYRWNALSLLDWLMRIQTIVYLILIESCPLRDTVSLLLLPTVYTGETLLRWT